MGASEEDEECCAICFGQQPSIALPCACRISYCSECWDRALATSVRVRGCAQCPSCRMVLRVDYDADKGGLVFSEDTEGVPWSEWRTHLYGKTKPVQIGLLRSFGASPSKQSGVESSGERAGEAEGSSSSSSSSPAVGEQAGACEQPLCVCGAHLERVSSKDRVQRMLEEADSAWSARLSESEAMAFCSFVTCDICERVATQTGALWTCTRGTHTVMHPVSYDVCERCFARYAGRAAAARCQGRRERDTLCSPKQESSSSSQSCALSLFAVASPWRWCWHAAAAASPRAGAGRARGTIGFVESIMLSTC